MKEPTDFTYSFPAIRGIQARREYYVTMCPMGLVPKLFHFDDDELPANLRAQRVLNKSRLPQLADYIIKNPENYVFSSLTASVDGKVHFEPVAATGVGKKIGTLTIPMGANLIINDGQHRRAAIEVALQEDKALEHETISIVLFVDSGLANSQQMFADLNRHAVRPARSLGILYDHRNPMARLADKLSKTVPVFKGMTETAKSSISNRSRKLFTLSSIYSATEKFLGKKDGQEITKKEEALAIEFWTTVAEQIPDWQEAVDRKVNPSELRRDFIHSHGVALQAIAIAGAALVASSPKTWKQELTSLKKIDWARENTGLWEGRAMIGGRLNKAQNNVILTANVLKKAMGLRLTPSEKKVETQYGQGNHE
jgi:DNA sulfur modification protein DndB